MLSSLDALLLETMAAASEIRGRWGDSRGRWLQGRRRCSSRRRQQRFSGGGGGDSRAGGGGDSGDAGGGGGEARWRRWRRSTLAAVAAVAGWGTGGASEQRAGSSQPVTPDRSLPSAWPRHSDRWVLFVSLPVKTWSSLYLRSVWFLAPKVVRISKF
jgi:hypothetical protein